jgi:hypothetical protein
LSRDDVLRPGSRSSQVEDEAPLPTTAAATIHTSASR